MKIGSIFAGYLTSISTFFGFNTPTGPQGHAICVNVVSNGIYTYNDQATKHACTVLLSKSPGSCHDCKIVEKDSIFCHSPDIMIDHLKFEHECKSAGAEKALSN